MNNRRILIVDDNQSLHGDFKKILSPTLDDAKEKLKASEKELFGEEKKSSGLNLSFDLDFAFQGEEALRKAVSAFKEGKPYALIFMDVRMPPGWDGIKTISNIQKEVPDTEFVICTAYSDYSLEEMSQQLGAAERILVLKKPFDSIEVQQMAIALTEKWSLRRQVNVHMSDLERLVDERTKERDAERAKGISGAKLMALGEMAGGIAHEINNPLTIIYQNAALLDELLDGDVEKKTSKEMLKKIITTSERIAKIIKGLRAFSRSGDEDPFEKATTGQIIEETLGICREKFKVHDVGLKVENSIIFETIECRQVQIIQVLINLLNNAYDAVSNLPERWVHIVVKDLNENVEISVEDSGHGIPKEIQEKIFQPFFTTKEIGKGTGLGLSVSKGIIGSHNGSISVDPTSKNTRFVIILPKKHSPESKTAKAA